MLSGSALLLDYTIDIALFSYFCSTYMDHFFPSVARWEMVVGPFEHVHLGLMIQTMLVIAVLIWLNVRGMREARLLNEIIGVLIILTECGIVVFGFLLVWNPSLVTEQWNAAWVAFDTSRFLYGPSLAIISFVGLESISQAAQETRCPATIVPRTSIGLIFTVFLFAVSLSMLTLGVERWEVFRDPHNVGRSVALIASHLPWIGKAAEGFTAALASLVLLISANSGVMSVSRLTFSMSRFQFISSWFEKVDPRRRTPVRTIVMFSAIGMVQVVIASFTDNAIDTLANLYAFGATLGYTVVMISLIRLRITDPYTPRPYKIPLNIPLRPRRGKVDFPVLGVIGFLAIGTVFLVVLYTHSIARIAGPLWALLCFIYYAGTERSMASRSSGVSRATGKPTKWKSSRPPRSSTCSSNIAWRLPGAIATPRAPAHPNAERLRVVTHFGFVAAGFSPAGAALKGGATSNCVTTRLPLPAGGTTPSCYNQKLFCFR